MNSKINHVILTIALLGGALLNCTAAMGQDATDLTPTAKDPARWYSEDSTAKARSATAQKEANAAYQQALGDCRKMRGAEAKSCTKEARDNYRNDMAEAKKMLTQTQ